MDGNYCYSLFILFFCEGRLENQDLTNAIDMRIVIVFITNIFNIFREVQLPIPFLLDNPPFY